MATVEPQVNRAGSGSGSGWLGSALLLVGGLALIGLMAYTLLIDGNPVAADRRSSGRLEVAVVLPTRDDWHQVRQGILGCVRREVVRLARETPDALTVQTPRTARSLRFAWVRAPGPAETRKVVDHLLTMRHPPQAVIGSVNTSLTAALAAGLRDGGGARPGGPVLLMPWATSTLAPAGPMREPVPLLTIDAGRTFRFCPDNPRLARLVVDCVLASAAAPPPHLAVIVEDPADPYSNDLSAAFVEAIRRAAPAAALEKGEETVSSPDMGETPGSADDLLAARLWRRAREAPSGAPTWLVLPLQGPPIRRIVTALDRRTPAEPPALHVLCGDGVGLTSLRDFARFKGLSVWCASAETPPDDEAVGLPPGALVPAEVVAALAAAVERADDAIDGLRTALASIQLAADDPRALGRSLAFDPSGQRRDAELGRVLAVRPGGDGVVSYTPQADGRWDGPDEVPDAPPVQGP